MSSFVHSAIGQEAARGAQAQVTHASDAAVTLFTQSKLALNGLLLAIAGFFGVFGVIGLKLQAAIISVYVMLFGLVLIAFGAGWKSDVLQLYFGFVYRPGGQLIFLLIAGNLAWSVGILGIVAAICVNLTAFQTWLTTTSGQSVAATVPLPDWVTSNGGGNFGRAQSYSSTSDYGVRRDELL